MAMQILNLNKIGFIPKRKTGLALNGRAGFVRFFKGKNVVCLNLSDDDLKLACARNFPQKGRGEILSLASSSLSELSDEDISGRIRSFIDNLNLKDPEIMCVIPSHLTITKNTEIPSRDPQEIKEIIDLQAGRHTPYSRDEIIVDYIDLGTSKENYTRILLVIVTLDVVKRQLNILEGAGGKIEKVIFAPEGITHLCTKTLKSLTKDIVSCLIHVDINFTDFIINVNGKAVFTRSIPVGAAHLNTEEEEARIRFAEEINKSLDAYQIEDIDKTPEEIVLTGALGDTDGFRDLLTNSLRTPVQVFDYMEKLSIPDKVLEGAVSVKDQSFLDVIAPLLTAGPIEANLVTEDIKLRKAFEERSRELIKIGVFIIILLGLIWGVLVSNLYFKTSYLEALEKKYGSVNEEAKSYERDHDKIWAVKSCLTNRGLFLESLSRLYDIIPDDIRLTNIKLGRQRGQKDGGAVYRFSIEGNSKAMDTVTRFAGKMEESEYFKEVKTRRNTMKKDGEEEMGDFEIVCLLEEVKK